MLLIALFIAIGFGAFYLFKNHITLDFKSLFCKGFKKCDNRFGLYTYCGKQGKGKTYTCINALEKIRCQDKKCIILTNVRSYYEYVRKNTKSYILYFESIGQIISYVNANYSTDYHYYIFFDEIFTILEKQTKINKTILSFISQLRKRQITFFTTAQEWSEINITFRRYSRFQVNCNMISLPIFNIAFIIYDIINGDNIHWDETCQDFVGDRIGGYIGKAKLDIVKKYNTFETIKVSI